MLVKSLEDKLAGFSSPAAMLREAQVGPNVYPGVASEFTNWRDEQRGWQDTCVLFNQSYHMADLFIEGPDALKLLTELGINSFKNFKVDQAKQFVPVNYDGYVIGDVILFYLDTNKFSLVGRAPTLNWVTYHAQTGGYNVEVKLDQRWALRNDGKRIFYRCQVQGPNAMKVIEKATGAKPPELKFFNMTVMKIGGRTVRALRHGMAGQPGFELFGPWEEREEVHQALVDAGRDFGMYLVGGRAYSTNTLESGWIPSPLPAVYTGEKMQAYRKWLPAAGYEGSCSLGGSFTSANVEDYYLTPWDLGYGPFVKFDHDFIGRDALEKKAAEDHRKKVTLALNTDDVMAVIRSQFEKGQPGKYIDFPSAVYSMHPFDKVTVKGGTVGLSTWIGYSYSERTMLALGILEPDFAGPGREVTLVWGEEDGGTSKPTVERHRQMEIRAIVSPVPYAQTARKDYAEGWRTQTA
jgi:syringate O-demethylase